MAKNVNYSTGNCSTGNWSMGNCSTGNWSTGNYSTGNWSISDYSTGHFSTEDHSGYGAFDKPCTVEEWKGAEKPGFLFWDLTVWVEEEDMSEKEKEKHPEYKTLGGFLRVRTYKEAWRAIYDTLSEEERKKQIEQLEALPNFDYDKFVEISGIDYRNEEPEADSVDIDGCKVSKVTIKEALKFVAEHK